MIRKYIICIILCAAYNVGLSAQTLSLNEAKGLYLAGEYEKALPVFEAEYTKKPNDASLNQWYGVCLFKTGLDLEQAEKCLLLASKKNVRDGFYYLGELYTQQYRFTEADDMFDKFEKKLKRKGDDEAIEKLDDARKSTARLRRMALNTEDIQIIDSLVVDKTKFLSAYNLSVSGGTLTDFNKVFNADKYIESVVYMNEKGVKLYFAQPEKGGGYNLFSMDKLLDGYGSEKMLSKDRFGLKGDLNYPFVMPDGITIYFAARDEESIGGYDIFVSRYNMNNDTYLAPERLGMPFNSVYNDYMYVVDEEKNVGWFVSDRFQPQGKVCVYTFIPNPSVKQIETEDDQYKINRARITAIHDSWKEGRNYQAEIKLAKEEVHAEDGQLRATDFEFVINDKHTYYMLSDFKSKLARDIYYQVRQLKSELFSVSTELAKQRDLYAKASDDGKQNMQNDMLTMERKQEQLTNEIAVQEVKARNEEIEHLKEAVF